MASQKRDNTARTRSGGERTNKQARKPKQGNDEAGRAWRKRLSCWSTPDASTARPVKGEQEETGMQKGQHQHEQAARGQRSNRPAGRHWPHGGNDAQRIEGQGGEEDKGTDSGGAGLGKTKGVAHGKWAWRNRRAWKRPMFNITGISVSKVQGARPVGVKLPRLHDADEASATN